MKSIVTNAAGVTVLRLIDNTIKTGGGPISIGATVIQAPKGPVGKVVPVTAANWRSVFGIPYPKNTPDRTQMEGLRHLKDALKECSSVNVVRVVKSDAEFPSIEMLKMQSKGAWAQLTPYVPGDVVTVTGSTKLMCVTDHTSTVSEPTAASPEWDLFTTPIETSAQTYGTTISVGVGYLCSIFPIDGDPSLNRSIAITDIDATKKRFTIKFFDKTELGEEFLLEYWQVGVNPLDKDDMGRSAFIETLLEERSSRFRCDWNASVDWDDAFDGLTSAAALATKPAFSGGTNGGVPAAQEWIAAWDMFRNEAVAAYLMFAAGNTDTDVLANAADIAELRHTMFFFDVPCYADSVAALTWIGSSSLDTRFAAAYHCPVLAADEWYGGKTAWGASGSAVAACAKGDGNFSGATPGVHYSPAGNVRGRLARTKIEFSFPADVVNRDALYAARINPVVPGASGGAIIDDALTLNSLANYTRFIWVSRIANYIDYRFLELASYMQHEPDGVTKQGLTRGMKRILDALVTSGALSSPRSVTTDDAASVFSAATEVDDNNAPYSFTVEQPEIDRWMVTWAFCPTGSARRIVGQPFLIQ